MNNWINAYNNIIYIYIGWEEGVFGSTIIPCVRFFFHSIFVGYVRSFVRSFVHSNMSCLFMNYVSRYVFHSLFFVVVL